MASHFCFNLSKVPFFVFCYQLKYNHTKKEISETNTITKNQSEIVVLFLFIKEQFFFK